MKGEFTLVGLLWLACLQTAFAQTQLLGNEGFESTSPAPWVLQGTGVQIATGSGAYDGSQYLSMGNASGGVQEVYQTITFPTNLIGATLSLANETVSSDPNGDDSFSIFLTDTALDPLLQIGPTVYSSTPTSWGYSSTNFITYQGSNILSSFAGKKVDLLFYVIPDSTYGNLTSFNVDDVSLVVGTTADIPANDDFTNAILIPSDGITNVVTTTYASREAGEPDIAGNKGGHSLWWTWTAPAIGTVTIATSDADFYTLLGVYAGSSISNLTVVTNYNGIRNSSGAAYVTFNVSAGTQYQITLDGYNGESGSAVFRLVFSTDKTPPKLTVASPTAGERWSNSVFNVTGKVKDSAGVVSVWYQLNTNAWTNNVNTTNGFTNWNVAVPLTPGPNKIKTYAVDVAGNVSLTNSVSFTYVPSAQFTARIVGPGKISPNYTNVLLALNTNYTLTATAGKGFVFSNWVSNAGVESNGPVLKFTMVSNLSYTVNFVTNPFTPAVGTYQGLFYNTNTNGVAQANSGFFSAQVNANGSFTAKFQQGSKSFPVSGQFSLTGGWATNALKSWDGTAISLQLNLTNGDVLQGSLSNAAWTTEAELEASRAVFSNTNHAPQAGRKYTLILPGSNSAALPGGNGFGSVSVNTSGSVTFSGALGDGTKVTASATESGQLEWPFYVSLYSGNGMMLGWLAFITNEPDRDIDGQLFWFKPSKPATTLYPAGFTNEIRAVGSAYSFAKGVPVLDLTNGYVILTNGGLTQDITNQFVLGANSVVTGSNKLHLTFATSTGLFQGATTNAEGKTISISGAVLQKQTNGCGLFLNGDQSGSVSITNQ
jgi:hypothetical protein